MGTVSFGKNVGGLVAQTTVDANRVTHREVGTPLIVLDVDFLPGISLYLKLESINLSGSIFHRGATRSILAAKAAGDTLVGLAGPAWVCLPFVAQAAAAHLPVHAEIQGIVSEPVIAELAMYGGTVTRSMRRGASDIPFQEHFLAGFANLVDEVLTQLQGMSPGLVVLPDDQLLAPVLTDLFRSVTRERGLNPPEFLAVQCLEQSSGSDSVTIPRTAAFAQCRRLAAEHGILAGLLAGAGLEALSRLKSTLSPSGPVIILDCYAPKFFPEFLRGSTLKQREENKLGGLITPR